MYRVSGRFKLQKVGRFITIVNDKQVEDRLDILF
jgi:hypothetical protein